MNPRRHTGIPLPWSTARRLGAHRARGHHGRRAKGERAFLTGSRLVVVRGSAVVSIRMRVDQLASLLVWAFCGIWP